MASILYFSFLALWLVSATMNVINLFNKHRDVSFGWMSAMWTSCVALMLIGQFI